MDELGLPHVTEHEWVANALGEQGRVVAIQSGRLLEGEAPLG